MKHYTIKTEDVGVPHLRAFGQTWPVTGFMGRILKRDVGKRVYLRGGILQVENDEQYMARTSCGQPEAKFESAASYRDGRHRVGILDLDAFEVNVAWLEFEANWEHLNPEDLRLMRIAFDWAMEYHQPAKTDHLCQSQQTNHNPADFEAISAHLAPATRCGCPTGCGMLAVLPLFRVTAYVHESPIYDTLPVDFCEGCGDDALESGLYCVGDDLLEPHHGPDCIHRMSADAGVGEGGQS